MATPYHKIGLSYDSIDEHSKALGPYERSIKIQTRGLPNHPDLAISYNNIDLVYRDIGEYYKVLLRLQKSLGLCGGAWPTTHSNIVAIRGSLEQMKKFLSNSI